MTTLADLGVRVEPVKQSSSSLTLTIGGIRVPLSSGATSRLLLTLPKDCEMRASFRRESWGDAVVKIFKKELQTGDAEFDKLVYITTDTPERTKAWLESADVRLALGLTIETGSSVDIAGTQLVVQGTGQDSANDVSIVKLVASLLHA